MPARPPQGNPHPPPTASPRTVHARSGTQMRQTQSPSLGQQTLETFKSAMALLNSINTPGLSLFTQAEGTVNSQSYNMVQDNPQNVEEYEYEVTEGAAFGDSQEMETDVSVMIHREPIIHDISFC